jgi:hypothetical protein
MYGQDLEFVLTAGVVAWLCLLILWAASYIWPGE